MQCKNLQAISSSYVTTLEFPWLWRGCKLHLYFVASVSTHVRAASVINHAHSHCFRVLGHVFINCAFIKIVLEISVGISIDKSVESAVAS